MSVQICPTLWIIISTDQVDVRVNNICFAFVAQSPSQLSMHQKDEFYIVTDQDIYWVSEQLGYFVAM